MIRLALLALLLSGCTHSLHLVHVSDFDPSYKASNQGDWITSYAEQFTVMGFANDTNYVDRAYSKLKSQCQGGGIQGIQTEFWTSHGFFSWTNKVRMQGLCLKKS